MATEFKDVKEVFAEHSLRLPSLNVLVPDALFYETLAIQPAGEIDVRSDFIGHSDHDAAVRQFSSFLHLASERNCDVVLSPEYSCPWDALTNVITQHLMPCAGKIWMLGCEAITPSNLRALISDHAGVEWIHEPIPDATGGFLDVLAYVTKAEANAADTKDVIILQLKTQTMGGNSFERDHVIRGNTIYIWHNPLDNIRLISLICSEALTFDQDATDQCRFDLHPYLIFHPQLIIDPHHVDISAYRGRLFAHQVGKRTEVLTLNWARGFTLPRCSPNQYGGSAIYTQSPEFELSGARLEANHQKGLFYSFWFAHRTDLCFFSFDQHVFHYRMPKTFQNVPATLSQRTGPEMLSLQQWDVQAGRWLDSANADDGFTQLCGTFQEQACDFCLSAAHTALDRERLLTLSAGKLRRTRDWHKVRNMDSYTAEVNERSKRLTFTHEQAAASNEFRCVHLARYITLQMNILTDLENFPPTIQDLKGNWKLQPPQPADEFRFNVVSRSGQAQGATAIFVDLEPPDYANQLKDELVREWGKIQTRRLVIWYRYQNGIRYVHPPLPSITDDLEPPASVASPGTL